MYLGLTSDNPVEHYKYHFPNDVCAEERVKELMIDAASKFHNKTYKDINEPLNNGLGMLELEILTLVEIEDLVDSESNNIQLLRAA